MDVINFRPSAIGALERTEGQLRAFSPMIKLTLLDQPKLGAKHWQRKKTNL